MNKRGAGFILIFGLFWTALVGTFDAVVLTNLYRQTHATGFAQTTGTIISSEVTHHRGSKGGTTYGVNIRYTYQVNGLTLDGDRYRYGNWSSSDSQWAYAAVAKNHPGAEVPVFYDANNPAESLLNPGVNGGDLFLLLFLTPFNMIMLGLWSAAFGGLFRKLRKSEAGGVKWSTDGRSLRVQLPRYSPVIAGLATTGIGSFASIFIVGIGTGFHPRLAVALATWLVLIGAGLCVAIWQWLKLRNGSADLVINQLEQTVELPATFDRKQRRTVPNSAITGVTVEQIAHRGSKGGTSYTYAVTLQCQGDGEKLTDWYDQRRAEDFAAWLREKIVLPTDEPPRKTPWRDSKPASSS